MPIRLAASISWLREAVGRVVFLGCMGSVRCLGSVWTLLGSASVWGGLTEFCLMFGLCLGFLGFIPYLPDTQGFPGTTLSGKFPCCAGFSLN